MASFVAKRVAKHRVLVLLIASVASIFTLAGARNAMADPTDACALLTTAEVSAALGIAKKSGKPPVATSPKLCMWSDSKDGNIKSRRITLSISSSATAFNLVKSSPKIMTEAVTGIGDEAFYDPKTRETPVLQVRKGDAVLTLRILNGLKSKPFTMDQVKAKEAMLAKAAATRF